MDKDNIKEFLFNKNKFRETKNKYIFTALILFFIISTDLSFAGNEDRFFNREFYLIFFIKPFFILILIHRIAKIFWYNRKIVGRKVSFLDIMSVVPFVLLVVLFFLS